MKLGMIFEGGACRAVFSAGVMEALMEENIYGDRLVGVSAGACYMMSYASGQRGRNLELIRRYIPDPRYMGNRYFLVPGNRSYFNLDFIYDHIPNEYLPFDYEALARYPGEIDAVVTNFDTGAAEYLPVPRRDRRSIVLRATCALPMMFPTIHYRGKRYMDGGITDPIPVKYALDAGCDKVLAVLTQNRAYIKSPEGMLSVGQMRYRGHPEFVRALNERTMRYNGALERLRKYEKEGRAFVIAPPEGKRYHRLERDPAVLESWYNDGYAAARERMEELKAFIGAAS